MTGAQVRAARALLRMDQATLAEKAGVSVETIKRAEGFDGEIQSLAPTLNAIKNVLEFYGLTFVEGGVQKSKDMSTQIINNIANEFGEHIREWLTGLAQFQDDFLQEEGPASVARMLSGQLSRERVLELTSRAFPKDWG